jgi:lipopolysaccharide export system permease protein
LIIDRYIIREISKPMAAICAVLIAIFGSYSAAQYLADAVSGLFPPGALLLMLVLRIAIALEVLLPTTLYLSVVIALGRMHRDSEMIALSSCGVGTSRVLKSVFYFALAIAILVAGLSIYVRPWAFKEVYRLQANAKNDFDITRMEAGNFYEIKSDHLVIFAEKVDQKADRAEGVFFRSQDGQNLEVIFAKQVYQRTEAEHGRRVLLLQDGYLYEFPRSGEEGKITQFQRVTYLISPNESISLRYKRKAASTVHLLRSNKPKDVAELQWRISTPLSTLLLALLGVPLSRTTPRQGKYVKVVAAVLIFAAYYNITIVAKNWIEKGVLNAVPGIWWVQVSLAGLILVLLWRSGDVFVRHKTKMV